MAEHAWNHALVEGIRATRERERSEPLDNLLKLVSHRLYSEKIHYVLELIQNAEDEGASTITFVFGKEYLLVHNNGHPFTSEDVHSICSVRPRRKRNKIGFFGIGFKSVFNLTDSPQVISGEFNFHIEDYIYPKPADKIPRKAERLYSTGQGAIFVLPYKQSVDDPSELVAKFKELDEKVLLFLDSLGEIKLVDSINQEKWSIRREPIGDSAYTLTNTREDEKKTAWRVFHKRLPVPKGRLLVPEEKRDIEETRITVALPLDIEANKAIKGSALYAYLATKKRTGLPFLIQADFLPTIGRENIEEKDWNLWLLRHLGQHAAEVVEEIREDSSLGGSVYEFIPLADEVEDNQIKVLLVELHKILGRKDVAKTAHGDWVKPSSVAIPKDESLRHIIREDDLRIVFGKDLTYVRPKPGEREQKVLLELGSWLVTEREVLSFIENPRHIKGREPKWFLGLYDYISTLFDLEKRYLWDEETEKLFSAFLEARVMLTEDERLVSLRDTKNPDQLVCYPQSIDLSEVLGLFTEGELAVLNRHFQESSYTKRKGEPEEEAKRRRVKAFLEHEEIGVREYFKQYHIINQVILPKFSSGKFRNYSDTKIYSLLNYIRNNLSAYETEIRKHRKDIAETEVFQDIRDKILVKCYGLKKRKKMEAYLPPQDVYFCSAYGMNELMEELFKGVEGVYFLSPYYLWKGKREKRGKKRGRQREQYGWKRFFDAMGVWTSPRVRVGQEWVGVSGRSEFDWVRREWSPQGLHEIAGDASSPDIEALFAHCANVNDGRGVRKRMELLWQRLEENWGKLYKDKTSVRYRYFHYTWKDTTRQGSSFIQLLQGWKWVPTIDRDIEQPEKVFLYTRENKFLVGDEAKYTELRGNASFLKDLGVRVSPNPEEVLEHLKGFKEAHKGGKQDTDKCRTIYSFLSKKLTDLPISERVELGKTLRDTFEDGGLLYLPRKDRRWWKPSQVFWEDLSETFGSMRGYVNHQGAGIYELGLKEFFSSLGINERPTANQCLEALEQVRDEKGFEHGKAFIGKVYMYLERLLVSGQSVVADWNKAILASVDGEFLEPVKLLYADSDELLEMFSDRVNMLWLPYAWKNVQILLQMAGIESLSKRVRKVKKLNGVREVDSTRASELIAVLCHAERYVRQRDPGISGELLKAGVFAKLRELGVYEVDKLNVQYELVLGDKVIGDPVTREREVYYSAEENRLYVKKGTPLLSSTVAKEASIMFPGVEQEILPFLDSLLSVADDGESLAKKLSIYGITVEEEASEQVEQVEIEEEGQDEEVEEEEEAEEREAHKTTIRPEPPEPPRPATRLIDLNAYVPEKEEEFVPYKAQEGKSNLVGVKGVELQQWKGGTSTRPSPLCVNDSETLTPPGIIVEGGERTGGWQRPR